MADQREKNTDAVLSWASGNREFSPGGPGDTPQVPAKESGISGVDAAAFGKDAKQLHRKPITR